MIVSSRVADSVEMHRVGADDPGPYDGVEGGEGHPGLDAVGLNLRVWVGRGLLNQGGGDREHLHPILLCSP